MADSRSVRSSNDRRTNNRCDYAPITRRLRGARTFLINTSRSWLWYFSLINSTVVPDRGRGGKKEGGGWGSGSSVRSSLGIYNGRYNSVSDSRDISRRRRRRISRRWNSSRKNSDASGFLILFLFFFFFFCNNLGSRVGEFARLFYFTILFPFFVCKR